MRKKTESFLDYEVKELSPKNEQEAKMYLSLIRNIHSKKIKGQSLRNYFGVYVFVNIF